MELSGRRPALAVAAVVALALAASATGLANGFAYDDNWVIERNSAVHTLDGWWRLFAQAYWPPPNPAAYRPLTALGFAAQWVAGGGAPWVFHLTCVVLYAGACAAFCALATAALPRAAALAAAALFAVHPVHVEAVGNVVGQAELLAALFALSAVALYVRRRRTGDLGPRHVLAIAVLYALACLSKESGIVLPALLLTAECTVVRDPRPLAARARALRPGVLLLAAVGLAFLAARARVLGGVAGAGAGDLPHQVFVGLPYGARLLTMLGVVQEWARLLFWPARLSADYAPPEVPVFRAFDARLLPSLLLLAAAGWAAAAAYRRRPAATLGIAWVAITLFPVSNVLVATGVFLAERTLLLPSAGAMLLAGAAMSWARERRPDLPRPARLAAAGALAVLVALGGWRSAARQRVWRDNVTLFEHTYAAAPRNYRVHMLYGVLLFELGERERAERALRTAMALYPSDPHIYATLGKEYERARLCEAAVPMLRRALALAANRPDARLSLVKCLMRAGDYPRARAEARIALVHGHWRRTFRRLAASADSAMTASRVAAR